MHCGAFLPWFDELDWLRLFESKYFLYAKQEVATHLKYHMQLQNLRKKPSILNDTFLHPLKECRNGERNRINGILLKYNQTRL